MEMGFSHSMRILRYSLDHREIGSLVVTGSLLKVISGVIVQTIRSYYNDLDSESVCKSIC
jgi:hypothetical protein